MHWHVGQGRRSPAEDLLQLVLDSSATLQTSLVQNLELARTDAEGPRRVDLAYFAELNEAHECYVAVRGGAGRVHHVPQRATVA